jgi:hypothetical protein
MPYDLLFYVMCMYSMLHAAHVTSCHMTGASKLKEQKRAACARVPRDSPAAAARATFLTKS